VRCCFAILLALCLVAPATSVSAGQRGGAAPAPAPEPNPGAPMYRQTGEQYRVYDFPATGESVPYRLFVPATWTPAQRLPMLVTLRAGTSVNNSYRSNNDLVKQAAQRGYM
jgi:hypothetical protein